MKTQLHLEIMKVIEKRKLTTRQLERALVDQCTLISEKRRCVAPSAICDFAVPTSVVNNAARKSPTDRRPSSPQLMIITTCCLR